MICHILNGEFDVTPIRWNPAGKAGASPSPRRTPLYSAEPGPPGVLHEGDKGGRGPAADPEETITALQKQAERQAAEAYRKGFAEGSAAAAAEATERERSRQEQFGAAIEHLASYRARIRREAEADLVRLSLAIARRLMHRELHIDPQALLGLLKAALERIEHQEAHRVRVHPALAAAARQSLDGRGIPIEVVPDSRLAPGGAVFETRRGDVDAGLETQLAEIESGFVDLLPKGGA